MLTSVFFADFVYGEDSPAEPKERLVVNELNFNKETGIVSYELAVPAWVRIRLGLKEGPMCKTLIDWEERPAGRHEELSLPGKDWPLRHLQWPALARGNQAARRGPYPRPRISPILPR